MNAHAASRPDEPGSPLTSRDADAAYSYDTRLPLAQMPSVADVPPTRSHHQVDYEACLERVKQLGSAMRAAAARVRTRETMAEELARNSRDQIGRAEEAMRLSEERARESAAHVQEMLLRAERAELRAHEAETWLNRLFETMQQELQGVQSDSGQDLAAALRPR